MPSFLAYIPYSTPKHPISAPIWVLQKNRIQMLSPSQTLLRKAILSFRLVGWMSPLFRFQHFLLLGLEIFPSSPTPFGSLQQNSTHCNEAFIIRSWRVLFLGLAFWASQSSHIAWMLSWQLAVSPRDQLWHGELAPLRKLKAGQEARWKVWQRDTARASESLDEVQLVPQSTWLWPAQLR